MNVFSYLLAEDDIPSRPETSPTKFTIDDNIGEAIHIHYRNLRQEMTVNDFQKYADEMDKALEMLEEEV